MRVYVMAEIGINHNGSMVMAKRLIEAAKEAGCDAVKFQKRTVEAVYTPDELARPRESVFGATNGDLKRGLEFSYAQYTELADYSRARDLDCSASCWDRGSVLAMAELGVPWLKVPSALITDIPLLGVYRETGIPVILSTGMSTEWEVDQAVRFFGSASLYALLHCHSAYPSPIEELNLSYLERLREDYPCPIGYSSHTVSPWPCLMAVGMGARVVEFHLTLDRTLWGSDQAASLEPKAAQKLVEEIRTFERAYGDGVKRVMPSEVPIQAKLRRV